MRHRLLKPRFVLLYPLAVLFALTAHTTERYFRVGVIFIALGLALRIWANGYVGHVKVNRTDKSHGGRKIGRLITGGPYAFVRHPLYLGSFLLGAGFCFIAGSPWLGLATLGFFLFAYRRKMAQEESLIAEEVGEPYVKYKASVPQWLPLRGRYPDRQGTWVWQGFAASREWKTIVWTIVLVLVFYLREEFFQEHELFTPESWPKHAVAIALIAAAVLFDVALRLKLFKNSAPVVSRAPA